MAEVEAIDVILATAHELSSHLFCLLSIKSSKTIRFLSVGSSKRGPGTSPSSRHRSIQMISITASQKENQAKIFWNLYRDLPPMHPLRFEPGDRYRIAKKNRIFEKRFTPSWKEEVLAVSQVMRTQPSPYRLNYFKGEKIQGSFYEPELRCNDQDVYRIADILRRRTKGGVKEIYIKWLAYPASFNSWMKQSDWR